MSSERMKNLHNPLLILSSILVCALILRILFPTYSLGTMALGIADRAYNLSMGGGGEYSSMGSQRFALLYPTALLFKIFGVHHFVLMIIPIFCSLGQIVITYLIGKNLFDVKTGLIGAALLSFYSFDINVSTVLYPDGPLSFCISLSILFFIMGRNNKSSMSSTFYWILTGVFLGIAFFIKESAIFIGVFFILNILVERKIDRSYFLIALGFSLVLMLDCLYFYFVVDDFFHRFNTVLSSVNHASSTAIEGAHSMRQKWHYFQWFAIPIYIYGIFYYFVFISLLYFYVYKRERNPGLTLLTIWFVGLFLHIAFGSLIGPISYITQLSRYLTVVTVPSILIIAYFLNRNSHLLKNQFLLASMLLLCMTSLFSLNFDRLRHEDGYTDLKAFQYLEKFKNIEVYSNPKSIRAMRFLGEYTLSDKYKPLSKGENSLKEGSYVVVNHRRTKLAKYRHGKVYKINSELKKIYEIDNPAPALAYKQLQLMSYITNRVPFLPQKIKSKLNSEFQEFLDSPDATIFLVQ